MESSKSVFINEINRVGVLFVRERTRENDNVWFGALEFILNDGQIFVVGSSCNELEGAGSLYLDTNVLEKEYFKYLKKKFPRRKRVGYLDMDRCTIPYRRNKKCCLDKESKWRVNRLIKDVKNGQIRPSISKCMKMVKKINRDAEKRCIAQE